jgi:DNA-directed RNA polymerase III subunit RPC6
MQSLPPPTAKCSRPLYPRSESSRFPNLTRITEWIKKSGISEVKLTKDDIELLLRVLEFDGRVERIPSNGLIPMSEDEEDIGAKKKKTPVGKRKRRGEVSEDESDIERKKKRKKDLESEEEEERPKTRKPGKGKMEISDDEPDRKSKSKKGKKVASIDSDSDSDTKRKKKKKAVHRDDTESEHSDSSVDEPYRFAELDATDAFVYRAIRPIQEITDTSNSASIFSFSGAGSAWLGGGERQLPWAEAPCVRCPQVDFCEEGGPVNAAGCEYLKQWLDPERVPVTQDLPKGEDAEAAMLVEMEA